MSKRFNIGGVINAFELLRRRLEEVETRINDCVVDAVQIKEYGDMRELIEKAEGVDGIVKQVDTLVIQLTNLFGVVMETSPSFPPSSAFPEGVNLVLKNRLCDARAIFNGGSIVVLSGSTVARKEYRSLGPKLKKLRQELWHKGQLKGDESDHVLTLKTDFHFSSPSAAACFVVGYSVNGKKSWIVYDTGDSLGKWLNI